MILKSFQIKGELSVASLKLTGFLPKGFITFYVFVACQKNCSAFQFFTMKLSTIVGLYCPLVVTTIMTQYDFVDETLSQYVQTSS